MKFLNVLRGGLDAVKEGVKENSGKVVPTLKKGYESITETLAEWEERGAVHNALDITYDEYVIVMTRLGEAFPEEFSDNLSALTGVDEAIRALYESEETDPDAFEESVRSVIKQVVVTVAGRSR